MAGADASRTSLGAENPSEVLDTLLDGEARDEAAKGDISTEGMLSVEPAEVSDSGEGGLEESEVADGEPVSDALTEGEEVSLLDSYPSLSALAKSVPDGTDEDKVRFVNEWLATHVRVDAALGEGVGASDRLRAAEGALSAGAGDAAAVAFAFQAVVDELGIPCLCVQTADGSRVWNLVQVGGAWSHVDVAANAEAFAKCDGSCVEGSVEEVGHRCVEARCLVDAEALGLPDGTAAFEAVEGFELPTEDEPVGVEVPTGKDSNGVLPEEGFDAVSGSGKDIENEKSESDLENSATVVEEATGGLLEGDAFAVDGPKLDQSVNPEPLAGSVATMAASKTLPYNASLLAQVGKQSGNSAHGSCCACYACAYGDTMFTGVAQNHTQYGCGNCGWKNWGTQKTDSSLKVVYDQINQGKPVVIHVVNNSSWGTPGNQHWVLAIGYQNVSNANSIGLGNLLVVDPWDASVIVASKRYNRHSDNRLRLSTLGKTVGSSHTHSYSVASYSYYHSYDHRVTYNKCSCGATKADTFEGHDFQWHGLTEKCTKCGAVYDKYTSVMEYFTNKQTTLYQGAGYNQTALKTIPAHTVVKPLESPRDYAAGRFQLKVSYGGATGYIWASDVTPNNNGGVHSWKNGVCTQCGVKQAPSATGTYQITADKTAYLANALRGTQLKLKAGDTIRITKVETTTAGYLWGWTDTGYTVEMTYSNMKYLSSEKRHGTVTTVPSGTFLIRAAANRYYGIDIYSASSDNGANVQLWGDNGSNAQMFTFQKNDDGTYCIVNVRSGKALEVQGWSMASGGNVDQWNNAKAANQRWYVEKTKSGTYAFRNKYSNLYMDITGGSVTGGTNIQQYGYGDTLNQQFYIEPVSKGTLAQQTNNVVSITGVNSSYTYTGAGITPTPTVRKRVYTAENLRVPASGTPGANSNWIYRDDTVKLKAGRTYVLEVGAISHDAGNGTAVVALAYDFGANKTVAPDMVFSYSTKTQYKTFTPSADCTLIFYSGKNGACGGNVSTWKNVRVYETLVANADYKVAYRGNVNAGKAYVDVTGINGYSDVRSTPFTIAAKAATPTVSLSTGSYAYNGQARKPGVTVKVGGRTLKSGTDYTVAYSNNVKPGTATVRVTLKGNYSGSASKTFTIKDNVPSAPASKNGWAKSAGGTWYYYQAGKLAKGWQRVGGTWYYLDPSTGAMATGWKSIGGTWYYLRDWGGMAEGWELVGGTWYYLEPGSGAMATGWKSVGGTWYYFKGSGAMAEGWQRVGGAWYYLNPGSGAMAEGWAYVGGDWYYLEAGSGAMRTGWYQVGGEWYCSDSSGRMLANCWVDGTYWVGPSGAMATSSWVDGGRYWVGPDGRWVA